jgi:hypothetical protein
VDRQAVDLAAERPADGVADGRVDLSGHLGDRQPDPDGQGQIDGDPVGQIDPDAGLAQAKQTQ